MYFTTGVTELDSLIGESLTPGTTLLIAGNPGAGKTTLASQICYANAKVGRKCFYVSFQEHKEKLFRNMARFGMNLKEVEDKGLFRFIKLPIGGADELLSIMAEILPSDVPEVMVIDSINALLELTQEKEQRALLQNFVHTLAKLGGSLVVLVAEMPIGLESLKLGSVDFVVDAILYLKHRVIHGLLTRVMEIRKVRGAPLTLVEVPFSIREGEGVHVYVPPKLERLVRSGEEPLNFSLDITKRLLGHVSRGSILIIDHLSTTGSPITIALLLDMPLSNNMKALLIIHKYSEEDIKEVIMEFISEYGDYTIDEIQRHFSRFLVIEAVSPTSEAPQTIAIREIRLVEKFKPDVVIRVGTEFLSEIADPYEYKVSCFNNFAWLKSKGITSVEILYKPLDRLAEFKRGLADAVLDVEYVFRDKEGKYVPIVTSFVRGRAPVRIEIDDETMKVLRSNLQALLAKTIRV